MEPDSLNDFEYSGIEGPAGPARRCTRPNKKGASRDARYRQAGSPGELTR